MYSELEKQKDLLRTVGNFTCRVCGEKVGNVYRYSPEEKDGITLHKYYHLGCFDKRKVVKL